MTHAPCLIVVDDEPVHRKFAKAVLTPAGWHVQEAADGAQALEMVRESSCALLLLDIQMPAPDGFAVARTVRASEDAISSIPILAFTTLRGAEAEAKIRAAGMDGYIAKPCAPEALIASVRPWWPEMADPATEKLAALFGAEELGSLIGGFREQLAEALDQINEAEGAPRAHRIAGIAGTLGFSKVYEAWLALSEGDLGAIDEARLTARKALRMIDRGVAVHPEAD